MSVKARLLHAVVVPDPSLLENWLANETFDVETAGWLDRQGLAPLVFYKLRQTGLLACLPIGAAGSLRAAFYAAAAEAELHGHELAGALAALDAAGVAPILFKGAALAGTVYPNPACRRMGDLDLWVTTAEMPRAVGALEALGYIQQVKAQRPLALQAANDGEVQMFRPLPAEGLIELHWGAFSGEWLRRTAQVDVAAIRTRAIPAALRMFAEGPSRAASALTLAPEDAILQLAVHFAINHQLTHPWGRGLADIALLARFHGLDWDAMAERARAWRIATATWVVLRLAVELVGLTEAERAIERLAPSPLRCQLLKRILDGSSIVELRDLTRGWQRFMLQTLLVDRPRDAIHLVCRALWPEREWLVARYGRAGAGVRWRHLVAAASGRP